MQTESATEQMTQPFAPKPLVEQCLADAGGIITDAADLMFDRLTKDRAALSELLPNMVRAYCRELVAHHVGTVRLASWTPPNADPKGNADRLRTAVRASLLDFPLPGGKRLGDATGADVAAGAAYYRERADDAAWKARWLARIAATVGMESTVAAVLTEAQLSDMKDATNAN